MSNEASTTPRPRRSWCQFSIKALLGVTVFVALGCTALLNASEWWGSATCTLTLLVLLAAVLLSVFRRGPRRAFWLGFAIFGWGYVLLILWPAPDRVSDCRLRLLTTKLAHLAYNKLLPLVRTPPPEMFPPVPFTTSPSGGFVGGATVTLRDAITVADTPTASAAPRTYYPDYSSFVTVAEWLWTLVLAMLGGLLARFFYATRETQR